MSVGGKVIDVIILKNKVYIDTIDHKDKCAIYVERDINSEKVSVNDIVWWQGKKAYWTTSDRKTHIEVTLNRIGYSGVDKPLIQCDCKFDNDYSNTVIICDECSKLPCHNPPKEQG